MIPLRFHRVTRPGLRVSFESSSRSFMLIELFFLSLHTRLAIGVPSALSCSQRPSLSPTKVPLRSCSSNLYMRPISHPTVPATVTTKERSIMTPTPTSCDTHTRRVAITFTRALVPVVTPKRIPLSTSTLLVCPLHSPQLTWAAYATHTTNSHRPINHS